MELAQKGRANDENIQSERKNKLSKQKEIMLAYVSMFIFFPAYF